MKTYQCHKQVEAFKIFQIIEKPNPDKAGSTDQSSFGGTLHDEDGVPVVEVSVEYMAKHNPRAGGYYVKYQDGYESFSPAEAFEGGYSELRESA